MTVVSTFKPAESVFSWTNVYFENKQDQINFILNKFSAFSLQISV